MTSATSEKADGRRAGRAEQGREGEGRGKGGEEDWGGRRMGGEGAEGEGRAVGGEGFDRVVFPSESFQVVQVMSAMKSVLPLVAVNSGWKHYYNRELTLTYRRNFPTQFLSNLSPTRW